MFISLSVSASTMSPPAMAVSSPMGEAPESPRVSISSGLRNVPIEPPARRSRWVALRLISSLPMASRIEPCAVSRMLSSSEKAVNRLMSPSSSSTKMSSWARRVRVASGWRSSRIGASSVPMPPEPDSSTRSPDSTFQVPSSVPLVSEPEAFTRALSPADSSPRSMPPSEPM